MLSIRPITLRAANAFVAEHHRHNQPTSGHKWSVACYDGERLCGVAIAGQPVARKLDDGLTVEIRRVCTDGTRNACSILYGACARVARDMGYKRVITYTLVSENGASLKASGFMNCGEAGGVSWNMPSRPREIVQVTLFGEERKYPDEKRSDGKSTTNKGVQIMGKPYRECPHCGAHLDAGEICDCREPRRKPQAAEEKPRRMRLVAICREVDPETGNVAVYQVGEEMTDRTISFLQNWVRNNPGFRYFTLASTRWERFGEVIAGILKRRTVTAADVDRIGGIVEL